MEQFIIVLIIATIGIVKWLMEKSAEQRAKRSVDERVNELERQNPSVQPPPRYARPIDPFPRPLQEAERRLREALGIPDDAAVPQRRPVPQPAPPPVPQAPVARPAFRVEEVRSVPAVDLERRMMAQSQPTVHAMPRKKHVEAPVAKRLTGLDELLRSRDGLRRAVVIQEILGTPKGLVF
jgi:hypothetical protein